MAELRIIKRIPVGPVALIGACIEAVIGFIYGVIWAIAILGLASGINAVLPHGYSVGSGATAAVSVIVLGIIFGFIGGYIIIAIVALLYNWLAPRIGGVKLEFE